MNYPLNFRTSKTDYLRLTVALVVAACGQGADSTSSGEPLLTARAGVAGRWSLHNGRWFDGERFVESPVYVEDGVFVASLSGPADSIVDLQGAFVVPPFGDAHAHNLDTPRGLDGFVDTYLTDGIFYVQILTNLSSGAAAVRDRFVGPASLDVIYANGGITGTRGHPSLLYESLALGLFSQTQVEARLEELEQRRTREGDAYWLVDSVADLDAKWEAILATNPDVLKIFLLDAAGNGEIRDGERAGRMGLQPEIAGLVVDRAHAEGLRVYAHVETAEDFRIGLDMGVDGFAHLPGYGLELDESPAPFRLSRDLIEEAGRRRIVVTPTIALAALNPQSDTVRLSRLRDLQREGVTALHQAGARIALGMDGYGITAAREAAYLAEHRFFDPPTLLDLLSRVTPQAIFPGRAIGKFAPGYEASFLILRRDPLSDWQATAEIERAMKQGAWLRTSGGSTR